VIRVLGRSLRRLARLHLALALPAVGVIVLAEVGSELPLVITAIVLVSVCAVNRPVVGAAVIVVAASDPSLFREPAFGRLTIVDLLIATVVVRAAFASNLRRPTGLGWCALGFLLAGAVATAVAHEGSAPSAFGRVATYVVLGLALGSALGARDRLLLTRIFVGAQAGQALAALTSITSTIATDFPFGRYVGTLSDPAQFGIPIAFAAVLVARSPHIVRDMRIRGALLALFIVAVAGSATRSAWAVMGVGALLVLVERVGSGRGVRIRVTLALCTVAAVSAGTFLIVLGSGLLGLKRESTEIRRRSIETAWTYMLRHPVQPLGLGNHPELVSDEARANLMPDSSFEDRLPGWVPFRGTRVKRNLDEAVFGRGSLNVRTLGADIEEGVATSSIIPGFRGGSTYTFSIYAKIPPGVSVWLYGDEYDLAGRWSTYGYTSVMGDGTWKRYSRTWKAAPATAGARLYVLTGVKTQTAFSVDAAQLERGNIATGYADSGRLALIGGPAIYNTWFAVAVALGIAAAGLLFALAAGAAAHAYRLGEDALSLALVAMLVPSLTENFVYAASMVTLVWLATLGLTATVRDAHLRSRKTQDSENLEQEIRDAL
jgi:hypothetical protein